MIGSDLYPLAQPEMFMNMVQWVLFNLFIIAMLLIDLFIFNRNGRQVSLREAILWSIFWIFLALLFNALLYFTRGSEDAVNFLSGYLIEKSLSVDNLFVFLLIFKYFKTPHAYLHKVLFSGILGAIVMRALFIWLGITLISQFEWMIYLFGIFLIFTGIKLGLEQEKEMDPEKNIVIRLFRYFFPVTNEYHGDRFFVKRGARYVATPLFIVLLVIETTDVIFAVDSIPAILAITFDPFIVYTSNIFAILGLRSLFFVLERAMHLFHYLHYGLAVILIFIGFKMLFSHIFPISSFTALGIVCSILAISIIGSLIAIRKTDE